MTLTDKKIKRMVDHYQYINAVVSGISLDGKGPEERMTQLYFFLRDQMQDVERQDLKEAAEARRKANG